VRASSRRIVAAVLLLGMLPLAGCRFTTRKLPKPILPSTVQTVPSQQLVDKMNERWDALKSLRADVQIQFTQTKIQEEVAKDYTSFPAIILLRKPGDLRVVGFVPVVRTRMFDMVSNGADFTLYLPTRDLAYEGPNSLTHKSPNTIENMRPGFFMDSLIVRSMAPQDEYMVTADTDTVEDVKRKHLLLIPEYILSIMRRKPNSQELQPIRVVHFHRDDLMPYQQELYDDQGNLETEVTYGRYVEYGINLFPSTVTIKRPLEGFQAVLTVQRVSENVDLKDDQFQLQIPEDTKVQHLQ
jgi:outer membrane lipoprotein-sorting protein